jgi:hypothetical protein
MGFFYGVTLKENVYAVRSMTIGDFVARLKATVTMVNANMLRFFERTPRGALPSALKWTEDTSDDYCNYKAPVVSLFHRLFYLTAMRLLKTKDHRVYIIQYFQLVFNK